MKKKKSYDLYKCYGLIKLMQEKHRVIEQLLDDLTEELNCSEDWVPNIDLYYNDKDITIEEVKDVCEEYFNKK